VDSNLKGFMNVLECARKHDVQHLVYASSSSVYGGNTKYPFCESDGVDHPVSIYAATKKANELMAHAYSELFKIPTTGLRFFTVYGPWGRPDMSPFLFSKSILNGESIKIFNYGNMRRDFTYIDDVVECITRVLDKPATKLTESALLGNLNPSVSATAPYRIFNVGNSTPHTLLEYITLLENAWGVEAKKIFLPMQDGDVECTEASTTQLEDWINFCPNTDLKEGLSNFVSWYRDYYRV
jgi:UDP-glucuronate 4-epimerase